MGRPRSIRYRHESDRQPALVGEFFLFPDIRANRRLLKFERKNSLPGTCFKDSLTLPD